MSAAAKTAFLTVDAEAASFAAAVTKHVNIGAPDPEIGAFAKLSLTPGGNGAGPDLAALAVTDLSPTPADWRLALAQTRAEPDARVLLSHWAADRLATHAINRGLPTGQLLVIGSLGPSYPSSLTDPLRGLKVRLKGHAISTVTFLPGPIGNGAVHAWGLAELARLRAEGVIDTSILFDPHRSPAMRTHGLESAEGLFARALANLVNGHRHDPRNPDLVSVLKWLGEAAPFASFAGASRCLAEVDSPFFRRFASRSSQPKETYVAVQDAFEQAKEATEEALTCETSRTSEFAIDEARPFVIVVTLPTEKRSDGIDLFAMQYRRWLANVHPNALAIVTRGTGEPLPPVSPGSFLQVGTFYPVGQESVSPAQARTAAVAAPATHRSPAPSVRGRRH